MALHKHDPEFVSAEKVYAKFASLLPRHKRLNATKWSVRSGDNEGEPWAAKQILTCLRQFSMA